MERNGTILISLTLINSYFDLEQHQHPQQNWGTNTQKHRQNCTFFCSTTYNYPPPPAWVVIWISTMWKRKTVNYRDKLKWSKNRETLQLAAPCSQIGNVVILHTFAILMSAIKTKGKSIRTRKSLILPWKWMENGSMTNDDELNFTQRKKEQFLYSKKKNDISLHGRRLKRRKSMYKL